MHSFFGLYLFCNIILVFAFNCILLPVPFLCLLFVFFGILIRFEHSNKAVLYLVLLFANCTCIALHADTPYVGGSNQKGKPNRGKNTMAFPRLFANFF